MGTAVHFSTSHQGAVIGFSLAYARGLSDIAVHAIDPWQVLLLLNTQWPDGVTSTVRSFAFLVAARPLRPIDHARAHSRECEQNGSAVLPWWRSRKISPKESRVDAQTHGGVPPWLHGRLCSDGLDHRPGRRGFYRILPNVSRSPQSVFVSSNQAGMQTHQARPSISSAMHSPGSRARHHLSPQPRTLLTPPSPARQSHSVPFVPPSRESQQ